MSLNKLLMSICTIIKHFVTYLAYHSYLHMYIYMYFTWCILMIGGCIIASVTMICPLYNKLYTVALAYHILCRCI